MKTFISFYCVFKTIKIKYQKKNSSEIQKIFKVLIQVFKNKSNKI